MDMKHPTLAAALAAFQEELPALTKDSTAKINYEKDGRRGQINYGYAGLDQVSERVLPVLGRHGLAFTSMPTWQGNQFVLVYELIHEGGNESKGGFWPLPNPLNTDPKQVGSAITYARRYALMAATGTFPGGEDDDATAASEGFAERKQATENFSNLPKERCAPQGAAAKPATQAAKPGKDWGKASDQEIADLLDRFRRTTLEKAVEVYAWMKDLGLHNRTVPNPALGQAECASYILADRLHAEITPEEGAPSRSTVATVATLAAQLGLTAMPVGGTDETLSDAIAAAGELARLAVDTPHAQELQDKAQQSWETMPATAADDVEI